MKSLDGIRADVYSMQPMGYIRTFVSVVFVAAMMVAAPFGQILKKADLKQVYGSRWIPLPLPDSRIAPGTIVSIKKGQVAFESSLDTCGAPAAVLKPVVGNDTTVTTKVEAEYGADAALKIGGVTAGPEFSKVKKTSLKLENHHPEGLDRITLATWLKDPSVKLPTECAKLLTTKDMYLVQEAYKVEKGKITLYDEKKAKLALGGLNLGIVKIDANAKATKVVDDAIEFQMVTYTAIRRLQYLPGGDLKTLGEHSRTAKYDDAKARAALYPAAPGKTP